MDEYKNTQAPIGSGERASAIPAPRKCLNNVLAAGVSGLHAEILAAPPENHMYFGNVKTGLEADMILASRAEKKLLGKPGAITNVTKVDEMFARGELVFDREREERVTIVRTHVGRTKKGTAIHYVVDNEGNGWKQLETKLRKRR